MFIIPQFFSNIILTLVAHLNPFTWVYILSSLVPIHSSISKLTTSIEDISSHTSFLSVIPGLLWSTQYATTNFTCVKYRNGGFYPNIPVNFLKKNSSHHLKKKFIGVSIAGIKKELLLPLKPLKLESLSCYKQRTRWVNKNLKLWQ